METLRVAMRLNGVVYWNPECVIHALVVEHMVEIGIPREEASQAERGYVQEDGSFIRDIVSGEDAKRMSAEIRDVVTGTMATIGRKT